MTVRTLPAGRATTSAVSASDTVDWRFRGACREEDPELFFPAGQGPRFASQVEEAKQVCGRCPVRDLCLSWALETRQDTGVWGGLSEPERRQLHRRRPPIAHREGRSAVEAILADRMDEFVVAEAAGLGIGYIARELGTNTVTVNAVIRAVAERVQLAAAMEQQAVAA